MQSLLILCHEPIPLNLCREGLFAQSGRMRPWLQAILPMDDSSEAIAPLQTRVVFGYIFDCCFVD